MDDDDKYNKKPKKPMSGVAEIVIGLLGFIIILLILNYIFTMLIWGGKTYSPSKSSGCDVPKCNLTSDIKPLQYVNGVVNASFFCYFGSTQHNFIPPPDPSNYDFSTSSYDFAKSICEKCILTSFLYDYEVIPYKNSGCTVLNDVYTACSVVFKCSDKFVKF